MPTTTILIGLGAVGVMAWYYAEWRKCTERAELEPGAGKRLSKQDRGGTIKYMYDMDKVVLERDGQDTQGLIERWRRHYNTVRPHSSLLRSIPLAQMLGDFGEDVGRNRENAMKKVGRADDRNNSGRSLVAFGWIIVVGCVAVALGGCREPSTTASGPEVPNTSRDLILWAIASHRGDQAIVFKRFWGEDERGMLASVVDFAAQRERVIPDRRFRTDGAWSPDDRFFVSTAAERGDGKGNGQVGILEVATLKWRPIEWPPVDTGISPILTTTHFPSWSPDGSRILFQAMVEPAGRPSHDIYWVYLYSVTTEESIPIACGGTYRCGNPFWGDSLFVFRRLASQPEDMFTGLPRSRFFLRNYERGGQREILPHQFIEKMSVSPTGKTAAAICLPEAANQAADLREKGHTMYILTIQDGVRGRKLCTGRFLDFSWAAGGDRIVASLRMQEANPPWNTTRLAVIDATTGSMTLLSSTEEQPICGEHGQWVDDDTRIIYRRSPSADEAAEIWEYAVPTGTTRRLYPFAGEQ